MLQIKKNSIILLFSLIICSVAKGQSTTQELVDLCVSHLEENDIASFKEIYPNIFMEYVSESFDNSLDKAVREKNLLSTQNFLDSLINDPEMDALAYSFLSKSEYHSFYQTLPRWKTYESWIDSVKTAPYADIRNELWRIQSEDQGIRILFLQMPKGTDDSIRERVREEILFVDSLNTAKAIQILDSFGKWPGAKLLGASADQTLWLCLQHADQKPEVSALYLPMLKEAVDDKRTDPMYYAYLVDRIRMHDCKEQIYGTQTYRVREEDGNTFFFIIPIEDVVHVDQRRASMGLEPLSEYAKSMGQDWSLQQYKKELPKIWTYYRRKCE